MRGTEAAIVLRALAALVRTREDLSKQELVQLFFVSFGFDIPTTATGGRDEERADPFAAKSEAGRLGGQRSAEVRRAQHGTAQPPKQLEAAAEPPSNQPRSSLEAAAEAAPKQGHGFPPDPLSEREDGSMSESAERTGDSGSGSDPESGEQLPLRARDDDPDDETVGVHVLPPGRTRKAAKRVPSWRRVPQDWTIKPDHRSMALGLLVDVELEAAAFRDHEFARPRTDPDATFRNWIREASRRPRSRFNGAPRGPQPVQPSHGSSGFAKAQVVR